MKLTKNKIQSEAVALSGSNTNILLEWATGCGKSLGALKIVDNDPGKVLLVVAERSHRDNWIKEFEETSMLHIYDNTEIILYHSLHKVEGRYKYIILDEVHNGLSELRKEKLNNISFSRAILLSATLTWAQKVAIKDDLGIDFYQYKISLSSAIKGGLLPEPKVFAVPIELDDTTQSEIYTTSKGKASERTVYECTYEQRWEYLTRYKNIELRIKCTPWQKLLLYNEKIAYYKGLYEKNRNQYWNKNIYINTGSQRKRFIADTKTETLKNLIKIIGDKRLVCFTGSIEQVEEVGGDNAIHSKKHEKDNSKILEDFNNYKINSIFAVGKLREGVNLKAIEVGIITQLDSTTKSVIQMTGRTLRGEEPVQFILYVKNSQDELYMENALEAFDPNHVYVLSDINNIKNLFDERNNN